MTESLRLVIVESPYAAKDQAGIEANLAYARKAMADCFKRGEAPFVSHALYTQTISLDVDGGVVLRYRNVTGRRVDLFCDNDGDLTVLRVESSGVCTAANSDQDIQRAVDQAKFWLAYPHLNPPGVDPLT